MGEYDAFLDSKAQLSSGSGFAPVWLPDFLFDFQRDLCNWAIRKGRAAIFADCGLGKTPMQLVWAENVARHTGKNVLILTPLAVSSQTIREAEKFGVAVRRSGDGGAHPGITITNYERLEKFDPADFVGVVADESSILKSFDGVRRAQVTEFMRRLPYRLLCTATAAPNDYTELGTSSEALGYLGHRDMLTRFFKKVDQAHAVHGGAGRRHAYGGESWRFKGHAEQAFWRWVCSWARAVRRPADLGYKDGDFVLPALVENEHVVEARTRPDGMLFSLPAVGLKEQREERRRTIQERCERMAELVGTHPKGDPALIWCHLNAEGDRLAELLPHAVQISGNDDDEVKEAAFLGFAAGQIRTLITKPKIGAWGLNFQHCAHVLFFPSHSFEQYYQGVRRCWRFGQTRPVTVDVIATEGDAGVMKNLRRKAAAADEMFGNLVALMTEAQSIERGRAFAQTERVPTWL